MTDDTLSHASSACPMCNGWGYPVNSQESDSFYQGYSAELECSDCGYTFVGKK